MALNGDDLGLALATALGVAGNPAALAAQREFARALVTYLIAHTVVSVTTTDTVPALGLIAPGGLSPAPVTGSASGTGTGTGTIS